MKEARGVRKQGLYSKAEIAGFEIEEGQKRELNSILSELFIENNAQERNGYPISPLSNLDESQRKRLRFTLNPEAYLKRMKEFNDRWGHGEVVLEARSNVGVAIFPAHTPEQLAKEFVALAQSKKIINIRIEKDQYWGVRGWGRLWNAKLDIYSPADLEGDLLNETQNIQPAIIFPFMSPWFSCSLIQMCVLRK